jgi:hypothetical protein
MAIVLDRYWLVLDNDIEHKNLLYNKTNETWNSTWDEKENQSSSIENTIRCSYNDTLFIKVYLIGTVALISINLLLLVALINRSAQGSITDTHSRRHVIPLLYLK